MDMMSDLWECARPRIGDTLGEPSDWREVFSAITASGCRILVIGEFSYMAKLDNGFLIRFQGIFDSILKCGSMMTVLCGSHISVMNSLSEDAYTMKRFDSDFVQRHVSFVFEDICRDFVRRHPERIGFVPERVGRY